MEITVYSTQSCPYCVFAKDYLKEKKAEFKEVDVSKDKKGLSEMMQKSGQTGVPVLDICGKIIVGFDRDAIDAALAKKRLQK
jgi:glutaredoxin-like YruB-family protein